MVRMMKQRIAGNFEHNDRPDSPRSTEMTTIDITEGGPEIIHEAASSSTRDSEVHPEQVLLELTKLCRKNERNFSFLHRFFSP